VTADRVARWRAHRAKNVTHTAARKVGPSAIVDPPSTAPPATEANAPTVPSEETSDACPDRDVRPDEPADEVGDADVGADEMPAVRIPEAEGHPREPVLRCARCKRVGVESRSDASDGGNARDGPSPDARPPGRSRSAS
jgi:hypothetical protein